MIRIRQATKCGYIELREGGVADLSYPGSETRRGRVEDFGDTCPTLTAASTGIHKVDVDMENDKRYRIRRLTERECGRLMGVKDEDIDKILGTVSKSQAYKQFGNSIVVPVLLAIFSQLGIKGVKKWNDMTEDEIYELIGEINVKA